MVVFDHQGYGRSHGGDELARKFPIDGSRLAAFRARADAARGESRAAQTRIAEARRQVSEPEADAARIGRSRPGEPRGVVRIDADGRQHGRFESDHPRLVGQAQRRAENARFELAELSREQAEGAARRDHDLQIFARIERYVNEVGR
jgi:hypothetical protein